MESKATLHFIDSSSRSRAELARTGFSLGHHCEVYGDWRELSRHTPRDGIIVARDDPSEGGIVAMLKNLSNAGVWLPVIAFDDQPTPGRIVDAIRAGALDYLSIPLDEIRFERCLAKMEGEAQAYSAIRKRMIEARNLLSSLSQREQEVLSLLAEGCSNKLIARRLEISPRTVEIHRANMMAKLGANHAAEAVRLKMEAQVEEPLRYAG